MAGPCIISYKGKDYSYEEFATMLHDGLLAQLVDDNVITGIEAEQLSRGGRGEYKPRKLPIRVIEEFPELGEIMTDDGTLNYRVIPNSITLEEANGVINYLGEDLALKEIKNMDNGMSWRVRFTVGQVLAKRFRESGELDKMIDAVDEVSTKATELGQGIQALAMFSLLTPEGSIRYAVKQTKEKIKKLRDKRESKFQQTTNDLKKVNKEVAKEVTKNLDKIIDKSQEIKPNETTDTPEYGAKNKIVTKERYKDLKKAIKGKFFSNLPPELFEIAAYHLEASGRQFSGFAKKMIRDFGNKVKPHLKTLYDKAKANLSKEYNDFEAAEQVDQDFSTIVGKEVKKSISAAGVDLKEIIESHYTKYEAAKRSLTEKFIQDAGLTASEAQDLAKVVQAEFDKLATERKQKIVDKLFTTKEKIADRKKKRTTEEEIVRLSNLGVFTNEELIKKFGEKMGWPSITKEQIKEIEKLAQRVQDAPEGLKRFKAVEDLMSYQANMKGDSLMDVSLAVYYANILSGPLTHIVNIVANMARAILEFTIVAAQNPKNSRLIVNAYLNGISRGLLEGVATLQTGYSPIRGKVEVPNVLERTQFWGGYKNPANWLKFVRRAMVAADVVFFEGAKEMRMYQQAIKFAKDNDIEPGKSAKERAAYVLGINNDLVSDAQAQAQIEYEAEVERINSSKESDVKKKAMIASAKLDAKRRVYEIIESEYPANSLAGAQSYAARTTYNYPPEGLLGVAANAINSATTTVPVLKLFVPFTNIIANIMNETINYTPWGFARAAADGSVTGLKLKNATRKDWDALSEEQKKQEKVDLVYKALIGTTLMAAVYMLSNIKDDDDEPILKITAGGTGNYAKNQALKARGYQEYSIKVGDKWISYKETPLFIPFAIIGTINDYDEYNKKSLEDPEMQSKVSVIVNQLKDVMFNATAIAGMNTFLKLVTESNNETMGSKLQTATANLAKGFVVPNLYTQTAREIESVMGIPMKETKGTFFGPMLADIPFARDQYFNKVNVFGEEVIPDTDRFVSTAEDDKLIDLFIKQKYYPVVPSIKSQKVIDSETNKERLMTQEEYYKYAKKRGETMKEFMLDMYDTLNDQDPAIFAKIMNKIVSASNTMGKLEIK
jgi:hypothetical protein